MKQKSILIPNAIIGILMVLFVLPLFIFREVPSYEVPTFQKNCMDDWESPLGLQRLSNLRFEEGQISLTKTVDAGEVRSGDLCFSSTNISFEVYVNDRLVYRYEPELPWLFGASYGHDIHTIPIQARESKNVIRIEARLLGDGMWGGFQNAYFQNGSSYVQGILSSRLVHYYYTAIVFTFSLLLFVMAWFFHRGDSRRPEVVSLGVLGMVLSMWTESSDYSIVLLTGHPGLIRVISYYTLLFLPLPGITLVCHLTGNPKSIFQKIIAILVGLNFIAHVVILYLGLLDYHHMLIFSHGTFLIAVILAVVRLIRGLRAKRLSSLSTRLVLAAFMILTFSGVLDLVRYYLFDSDKMALFARYGLLIFIIVIGSYEVRSFFLMLQQSHEAEMMKRLAHRDGLTGVENRLAFTEFEQSLKHQKKGNCIFVQFDINDLKKMNDNYGHNAGDSFIIAGANAIRQSFGPYGRVFRTGGDEFVCVLTTAAPATTEALSTENGSKLYNNNPATLIKCYETCERHMMELINAYNLSSGTPVPLTIAYGMAEYSLSQGNPEPQERLADERMYMHKRMMKERVQH